MAPSPFERMQRSPSGGEGHEQARVRAQTMWHASLRTRLILIVVLAIVPALLLALGTGLRQRAMLVDHATQVAVRLVRGVAEDTSLVTESTRRLVAALATNPIVLGSDYAACSDLMAGLLAADTTYTNLA